MGCEISQKFYNLSFALPLTVLFQNGFKPSILSQERTFPYHFSCIGILYIGYFAIATNKWLILNPMNNAWSGNKQSTSLKFKFFSNSLSCRSLAIQIGTILKFILIEAGDQKYEGECTLDTLCVCTKFAQNKSWHIIKIWWQTFV